MIFRLTLLNCLLLSLVSLGEDLTIELADRRLRRCYQLAQETNNKLALEQILKLRETVQRNLDAKQFPLAEGALVEAEKIVGIDAGGKTMFGRPISNLSKSQADKLKQIEQELQKAMRDKDSKTIQNLVSRYRETLGDSAGLPDFQARPEKLKGQLLNEKEATELFLKILDQETAVTKTLLSGKAPQGSMARGFAAAVIAFCEIRPYVQKHFNDLLAALDELIKGGCECLISIQDKAGFFYFPDLRGKHLRYGEIIEKQVDQDEKSIREGWVIVPFPDGGSYYDTGESGIALLRAGETLSNLRWTQAGLLAAEWVISQPVVPNWNDNGFTISLLAQAYRVSKEKKYLEAAVEKFKLGLLPGQLDTGGWMDPQNARIMNHGILLRACNDLRSILPEKHEETERILKANERAAKYFVQNQQTGPFSVPFGLAELVRSPMVEETDQVKKMLASLIVARCRLKDRVRAGASFPEIAALVKVNPD